MIKSCISRCGRCCHIQIGEELKRCPHLVEMLEGTECAIYHDPNRLGKEIFPGVTCQNEVPPRIDCPDREYLK